MAEYQTIRSVGAGARAAQIDEGLRAHMNKVYGLMSVAMLVTAGVAWGVGTSDLLNFLRTPEQIDYLEEPDVFHDVFGHVPLLANPVFADYMQAYGEGGLRSIQFSALHKLARLYWYTVEFGLIETADGLRIYGAGLVSSHGETRFALDSDSPNRLGFDLTRVLRTKYRIDDYQQAYFTIPSFEHLLQTTLETDFAPLYERLESLPDLAIDTILPTDRVLTRGTQAYALANAG
jgi:phenylalanine-4-hydroxylase